jgi:cellobiose PTS system EIIC component
MYIMKKQQVTRKRVQSWNWDSLPLLDVAEKLSSQSFFLSVQRGLALVLPLIMIGALALLLRNFPFPALPVFLDNLFGNSWRIACDNLIAGSFGIASLAVLCTFSGALTMFHNQRHTGQFVSPVMAVVVILSCFFVATAPAESTLWKTAFSLDRGLIVALCVAGVGCGLFLRLAQCKFLQLPLGTVSHDPMVRDVFTILPASMLTISIFCILRAVLVMNGIADLHGEFSALLTRFFSHSSNHLGFGLVYATISQLFWFFGAHGPNLLFPVEESFLVPAGIANTKAILSGHVPDHVFTKAFFDVFTRIGGSGSTLCLILAILLGSRDGGSRKLCQLALLPALCNVNEPLLFGIPLVLNPIYLIPFVLTPLFQTLAAYTVIVLGFVPYTTSDVVWTTPTLVSGFVATGSIAGVLMQAVNIVLGTTLYYPFVKLSEQLRKRQGGRALNALLKTATGCAIGPNGRKCIDRPGEEGRLAKALAADLLVALKCDDQLFLEYQPQVDVVKNRVRGVEALLRWNHPAYGRIPPPVAVALAEDTGCIDELGLCVLRLACLQRAEWNGRVPEELLMSVNVSPKQLEDHSFDRHVFAVLDSTGVRTDQLEVEITESSILTPGIAPVEVLRRLKNIGVHVAIDDFGMGHTSLRYLNELPVDTIKLDRSLTEETQGDISDHIVRSMVELSRTIGVITITEGVETEAQLTRFRNFGCDIFQGYLFSRPLSGGDCLAFIQALMSSDELGEERAQGRTKLSRSSH